MLSSCKIGIYFFGGKEIGFGHAYRALAIYHWIKKLDLNLSIEFEFLQSDQISNNAVAKIFRDAIGVSLCVHDFPDLPGKEWDILIVDRLTLNTDLLFSLKSRTQLLICIDDTLDDGTYCDLKLNPLYKNQTEIREEFQGNYHEGVACQIIHPKFTSKPTVWREKVTHVLVMQGGADSHDTVREILDVLHQLILRHNEIKFSFLSPSFEEKLLNRHENPKENVCFFNTISDMRKFLLGVDLAISSGGITPFELAAMQIPSLLISAEQKELETMQKLAEIGCAINLGKHSKKSLKQLVTQISYLVENPHELLTLKENASSTVFCDGGKIINDFILKHVKAHDGLQ